MDGAKHRKLHDLLRAEILAGKYGRTNAFPSEAQLSRRMNFSRTTVRKALDELRHEGLIRCHQGKGAVVTELAATRTLGLILPGVSCYEYFQPIATELTRIAQRNHHTILFANVDAVGADQLRQNVRELAADFIKHRVSGVVYHPTEFQSENDTTNLDVVSVFKRAKIPVVLLDSDVALPPERSGFDVVSIDNTHAAGVLTRHLLERNARNVCVLMLPKMFPNMMDRVNGVAMTLSLAGREWSPRQVLLADPTDREAVCAFMKRRPRPDAFVCQNDALAADFAVTLKGLGYAIPDDVMLAGFDGMEISRVMTPQLTTIRQPYADIAQAVFDQLVDRIARPHGTPRRVSLQEELVVRASTDRKPKGCRRRS